jgi:uncharacterized coiled-coil protein SlyX
MALGKNSNDSRIKELEQALFEKELAISNLGKMIAERDELLSSFDTDCQYLLELLTAKEIEKLEEKKGHGQLSQKEKEQIATDVRNLVNNFIFDFAKGYKNKNDLQGMLIKGLVTQEQSTDIPELQSFKFYLLRSAFERGIVVKLVKQYAQCIQELIDMEKQLDDLKK